MWEWLSAPIDAARPHEISAAISWHARLMVLAWAVIAPLAVLVARFCKIMPNQNWPKELDNPFWWRSHWMGQSAVVVFSIIGFALVLPADLANLSLHSTLGYALLLGLTAQALLGLFRGSKGGPSAPARDGSMRGHHYDMTKWRRTFEALHKSLGYLLLAMAVVTVLLGLSKTNAPVWMWLALALWWAGLISVFIHLQARGLAIDTYQAIWGDDPSHPGNALSAPGWGMRRPGTAEKRK